MILLAGHRGGGMQRRESLWVQDQPGLQSSGQQLYRETLSQEANKTKNKKQAMILLHWRRATSHFVDLGRLLASLLLKSLPTCDPGSGYLKKLPVWVYTLPLKTEEV